MPVPLTGLVILTVIYGLLLLFTFGAPPDEDRKLLRARVTVGYLPFAVLVIAAMWTGRNLDEDQWIVQLLFEIGLGTFIICPAIGAGMGWMIWHIPPLRVGTEALWLFVFQRHKELLYGELYVFHLSYWMLGWAILACIVSLVVSMNIDFQYQWGEDYDPGA